MTFCVEGDASNTILKEVHPLYKACDKFTPKIERGVAFFKAERLF